MNPTLSQSRGGSQQEWECRLQSFGELALFGPWGSEQLGRKGTAIAPARGNASFQYCACCELEPTAARWSEIRPPIDEPTMLTGPPLSAAASSTEPASDIQFSNVCPNVENQSVLDKKLLTKKRKVLISTFSNDQWIFQCQNSQTATKFAETRNDSTFAAPPLSRRSTTRIKIPPALLKYTCHCSEKARNPQNRCFLWLAILKCVNHSEFRENSARTHSEELFAQWLRS